MSMLKGVDLYLNILKYNPYVEKDWVFRSRTFSLLFDKLQGWNRAERKLDAATDPNRLKIVRSQQY